MGVTSNLIDRIEPLTGQWSRATGQLSLLALVQEGQDELFDCSAPGLLWKGTDNKGWPPYLITVDGTYNYDITAANLSNITSITQTVNGTSYAVRPRKVMKVFVDTGKDFIFDRQFIGEPYIYAFNNPFRASNDRVQVADIPVSSYPATENDATKITFPSSPDDTTDIYFVSFAWEPPRLTSETINIAVPTKFYQALMDYVIGRVSQMDNGKENDRLARFYSGYDAGAGGWVASWKDQFQEFYSDGAQATSDQTVPLW